MIKYPKIKKKNQKQTNKKKKNITMDHILNAILPTDLILFGTKVQPNKAHSTTHVTLTEDDDFDLQ